jgi:Mce-associated membrane protein
MAVDADTPAGEVNTPEADDVVDYDEAEAQAVTDGSETSAHRAMSPLLPAFIAGVVAVVALGALTGWLGYRAHESQQMKAERDSYLQVARQGAVNLTTIDYAHADADVQRILDSATGQFYDEFSQRSAPFADIVKKSQSNSQGTITEAGLESVSGDEAQVMVAVSVKTAVANAPEQPPRSWRMRLTVQKSGQDMKIANVGFVA